MNLVEPLIGKNRNREAASFANINLLGRCNVDCFFCLGKDIEAELSAHNQLGTHFSEWKNFDKFLAMCKADGIRKLYITGQNTDSLLYGDLGSLVMYLHEQGFQVGLRTNGYRAQRWMSTINSCELSTGYSIHSLDPATNQMIGAPHHPGLGCYLVGNGAAAGSGGAESPQRVPAHGHP